MRQPDDAARERAAPLRRPVRDRPKAKFPWYFVVSFVFVASGYVAIFHFGHAVAQWMGAACWAFVLVLELVANSAGRGGGWIRVRRNRERRRFERENPRGDESR